MSKVTQRPQIARTAAALAAAATAVVLPWSIATTTAHAASQPAASQAAAVPPGVVKLGDGEACPPKTLCLYRDYGRKGPAYGIGAGYIVNLYKLPITGGVGGNNTMADNVSSWVNNTASTVRLTDTDTATNRTVRAGGSLEEPSASNDSVDVVSWTS